MSSRAEAASEERDSSDLEVEGHGVVMETEMGWSIVAMAFLFKKLCQAQVDDWLGFCVFCARFQ